MSTLQRLTDRGLVRRQQGKQDRRLKHVHPTPACQRLLEQLEGPARRAHGAGG